MSRKRKRTPRELSKLDGRCIVSGEYRARRAAMDVPSPYPSSPVDRGLAVSPNQPDQPAFHTRPTHGGKFT